MELQLEPIVETTRAGYPCDVFYSYDVSMAKCRVDASYRHTVDSMVVAAEHYDEDDGPEIRDLFLTIVLQRVDRFMEQRSAGGNAADAED